MPPEALPGWPWIRAAMLGLGYGREHRITVCSHLRMLAEDVLPTAVIEHHPPAVRIDYVCNGRHDAWLPMAGEVLHGRTGSPTCRRHAARRFRAIRADEGEQRRTGMHAAEWKQHRSAAPTVVLLRDG